jgi:hypothetical protein
LERLSSLANSSALIRFAHVVDCSLDNCTGCLDVCYFVKTGKGFSSQVESGCCNVDIVISLRNAISKWNSNIMASYPSLAFRARIKEGTLHKQEIFVNPLQPSALVSLISCLFVFKSISIASVIVNSWTEDQINCLVLDLDVTETLNLGESVGETDSENCLPSYFTCQIMVQLVGELKAMGSL